jgi:hypothetical protein
MLSGLDTLGEEYMKRLRSMSFLSIYRPYSH